jgi:phosphoribosylamine---glycine ligase
VHRPVLHELARRGAPFQGLLYAGLMRTEDELRVIEFNCRFGDPETQSLLTRLDGDLLPLLTGDPPPQLEVGARAAVTLVLSGHEYPEHGDQGTPIEGIEAAEATGALVFHAGTALHDGRLVTNGGRILNVVGAGATVADARSAAYEAAACIDFAGMHLRHDVAADA